MPDLTVVTLIYTGPRGYTLAHAAVIAGRIAAHTAVPYRFVVLSDQTPPPKYPYEVLPLPAEAAALVPLHYYASEDYPACLPKLWLFSDAARCLGERLFYVDCDALIMRDLAPILTYAPEAPFVWMNIDGKLTASMYRVDAGHLDWFWQHYQRDGLVDPLPPDRPKGDQGWMRHCLPLKDYPAWPAAELGIYTMKQIEERGLPTRPIQGARILHPTGKIKPWHRGFQHMHPWAIAHYPWPWEGKP